MDANSDPRDRIEVCGGGAHHKRRSASKKDLAAPSQDKEGMEGMDGVEINKFPRRVPAPSFFPSSAFEAPLFT